MTSLPPRLLFLLLLFPYISALLLNPHLTTPLINCPCTFTISRPSIDNTPFSIIVLTPHHHLTNPLSQHNLTNAHADYRTNTTALFYIHIPSPTRHALTIHSHATSFKLSHVAHTTCPTLLDPDPPGLFRQRIVGGSSASSDLRDFLTYLHNPSTGRACTGTIIAPRWVITAAHCNITPQHVAYLRGEKARQGIPFAVSKVHKHYMFDDFTRAHFDIAIVELATPATYASFMRVSVNPAIPLARSAARVLGYGSVAFDSPTEGVLFGQLRQVDVPIVTHEECVFAYTSVNALYQVCAGYLGKGGCDSCQGDSGGPLIQYDKDGEPVLVGVVSRGLRCGEARFPGIYIRVGAFEQWMDSIAGEYQKASDTKAVPAVTGSSRETFGNLIWPVVAICGGVLAIGVVVVIVVKVRRRQRGKARLFDKNADEDTGDTGDTEFTDGLKPWHAQRVQTLRHSAPVETIASSSVMLHERRPRSAPAVQHALVTGLHGSAVTEDDVTSSGDGPSQDLNEFEAGVERRVVGGDGGADVGQNDSTASFVGYDDAGGRDITEMVDRSSRR